MASKSPPIDPRARYWRTCQRKFGEGSDLGGKAIMAAASAGVLAPLASTGAIRYPNLTICAILAFGFAVVLFGIHLQAKAKPDE
jgi:hypothetical protein